MFVLQELVVLVALVCLACSGIVFIQVFARVFIQVFARVFIQVFARLGPVTRYVHRCI